MTGVRNPYAKGSEAAKGEAKKQVPAKQAAHTVAPKPERAAQPRKPQVSALTSSAPSLRTKLKRDIEHLKRQKLVLKQRREDEKRRKTEQKYLRKLGKKMLAEQTQKAAASTTPTMIAASNRQAPTSTMAPHQSWIPTKPAVTPSPAVPENVARDVKTTPSLPVDTATVSSNTPMSGSTAPLNHLPQNPYSLWAATRTTVPTFSAPPSTAQQPPPGFLYGHNHATMPIWQAAPSYDNDQRGFPILVPPAPLPASSMNYFPNGLFSLPQNSQGVMNPAIPFQSLPPAGPYYPAPTHYPAAWQPTPPPSRPPRQPKQQQAENRLLTPFQPPSPFWNTHEVLPRPLLLVKQPGQAGFGLTIQKQVHSALMVLSPTSAPRRRRRFFVALQVQDASEQLQRRKPAQADNIQAGDLVLTIHGQSVAGLTFAQACQLFATEQRPPSDDGNRYCAVRVARLKKPKAVPTTMSRTVQGPLNPQEEYHLAECMVQAVIMDPQRVLGTGSMSSWATLQTILPTSRTVESWQSAWRGMEDQMQRQTAARAMAYWKKQWQQDEAVRTGKTRELLTDAQRSQLRARPRPPKGCRCGGADHEYVNDPLCPLYSNVRRLVPDSAVVENNKHTPRLLESNKGDLNVVEKAFKDRIVRIKAEKAAQKAEAEFVGQMEEILLHKCSKAIFAPSLTCIVLSAVAELDSDFKDRMPDAQKEEVQEPVVDKEKDENQNNDSDDSDDDDVPLAALGKRSKTDDQGLSSKKAKVEMAVAHDYLATLLRFVSDRWGHVYREPSHVDYAWRWEVHHSSGGRETKWQANSKNPRRERSLSLENLRFMLDDATVALLSANQEPSPDSMEAMKMFAVALSPSTCGVYDELKSLIQSRVLSVNDAGIPNLTEEWSTKVDLLLLDDMDSFWTRSRDPSGKYGVSERVRTALGEKWRKTYKGWALASDPKEIVFDFGEFDEWRDAFEDQQQSKDDSSEGVGRFGV